MAIEFNELETQRFGLRCARVSTPIAPLDAVNAAARAEKIAFLSARISTDDIAQIQALEEDGFRLMDTLVYYNTPLDTLPDRSHDGLRRSHPEDAAAIADVARQSFAGYFGHYHADPRLDNKDADQVYVDWAEKSIRNSDAHTPATVMVLNGKIVSFLTMRIKEKAKEKTLGKALGELLLVGVAPDAQGQGVYGRVIDHGLATLKDMGCSEVITSTQVNNIAVQRAWGKRGFRMLQSFYTLHKWMDCN